MGKCMELPLEYFEKYFFLHFTFINFTIQLHLVILISFSCISSEDL